MHNTRFWTGLVFLTGVPMTLLWGTVWREPVQYATLEGRVTYRGQPITRGMVLFESLDRKRSGDIMIAIDASGYFGRDVDWRSDLVGRSRFRIHVAPDPRRLPNGQLAARPAPTGAAAPPMPGQPAMKPAGEGSPDWDRLYPEVMLGPEPTRLLIDLKD